MHKNSSGAKRPWLGSGLVAVLAVVACGDEAPRTDDFSTSGTAPTTSAGTTGSPMSTTAAEGGQSSATGGTVSATGGVDQADAGVTTTGGTAANGGSSAASTTGSTAMGTSGADASAMPQVDGGVADDGPIELPSPSEAGPYTVLDVDNVGEGYENPLDANDEGEGGAFCTLFVSLFSDDQETIDSYSIIPESYNMALYTLFYPERQREGQKFPLLSWANGTCAHTVGYGDMIKHVVSHGFIVISPHSRFTATGEAQLRGLDWALAANDDPESPLYQMVDTETIGVFGHSQGGGSTGAASSDPRVDSSILMHGGGITNPHAPVLYMTGENDISPSGVRTNYDATNGASAFANLADSDHVTMMTDAPRMAPEVTAWFRYTLLDDEEARSWYAGDDCVLCTDSEWTYLAKDLP